MAERNEHLEISDTERKAYTAALRAFGQRPEVTGIDLGYQYTDGQRTGRLAVRIHVREKRPLEALEAAEVFPDTIENVPVDVIEATYEPGECAAVAAEHHDPRERHDVLRPGISCGHIRVTAGTFGLIVIDNRSGRSAILSNWHVLAGDADASPGDPILQPGPHDGGRPDRDTIATLERMILNSDGDAAIALLNGSRAYDVRPLGTDITIAGIGDAQVGAILVKSGRSTGVTRGRVDGLGRYFIRYSVGRRGIDGFKLVSIVAGNPDNEEISSGGDSGSVWCEPDSGTACGLHFAGETSSAPGAEHAIACHLTRVFAALDLSLPGPQLHTEALQQRLDAEVLVDFDSDGESAGAADTESTIEATRYEKPIAQWRDPFSTRGPRVSCAKWAYPWPGAKICIGHKYQWQFMECSLYLVVTAPDGRDLKRAVERALRTGAVAAALAALVAAAVGGPAGVAAAKEAFLIAFNAALTVEITDATVSLDQRCNWSDWK